MLLKSAKYLDGILRKNNSSLITLTRVREVRRFYEERLRVCENVQQNLTHKLVVELNCPYKPLAKIDTEYLEADFQSGVDHYHGTPH